MRIALLALLSLWLAPAAQALYISNEVEKVPVTRVIENLEKRLRATPDDLELHYQLARVYAMAATTGTTTLKVINAPQNRDRDGVVEFSPPGSDNGLPENRGAGYPAVMPAKDFDSKQLGKAIWHYEVAQAAMKRSSKPDQVHWLVRPTLLGYAWCLDKAGRRSERRRRAGSRGRSRRPSLAASSPTGSGSAPNAWCCSVPRSHPGCAR